MANTFTAVDQSEPSRKLCPERLDHLSWIQIQSKLLEAQKLNQMCIHKEELSELDVHNRKSSILCSKIHALELFSLKDCDADHVTSFTGFAAIFLIAFRIVHIDDDLVLHRGIKILDNFSPSFFNLRFTVQPTYRLVSPPIRPNFYVFEDS